ncbi:MAG TPA: hypothetical protein VNA11_13835 [Pseudonocardia sp.]|nr:hypothetical protein [Pseudonocardia sp.]
MTTESGELLPAAPASTVALGNALTALRTTATQIQFTLPVRGAEEADQVRAELVRQLDDHLLPRLRRLDAPMLTVVGGSTGAGKSTLVNSLVRAPVSQAGVLRPTTRYPVLVCHPYDLHWFSDARVLPELTRTSGAGADQRTLRLVSSAAMKPGLAFLDAPDIDSVVAENRELAGQLLAAADMWLFVTTAARYADAVPWEQLQAAQARGTALAVLLDRMPPGTEPEVGPHLREMLHAHRLGAAPLFVIPEVALADGLLPAPEVAPLRAWFEQLAADSGQRTAVVRHTLEGALHSLRPRVATLAAQAAAQVDAAQRLREMAGDAYAVALAGVDEGIRDGGLLRGEALTRWQEFVGAGQLTQILQARLGRWRHRLSATLSGGATPGQDLVEALESGLVLLIDNAAERAAEDTATAWRIDTAGTELLRASGSALTTSSPGFRATVEGTVRDWRAALLELVGREGGARRVAAGGVNATDRLVMIAVFATTHATATPVEIVAGGDPARSQKALQAVLGHQVVQRLARIARADLLERVAKLLDDERERYDTLLATRAPDRSATAVLERAVAAVEQAR